MCLLRAAGDTYDDFNRRAFQFKGNVLPLVSASTFCYYLLIQRQLVKVSTKFIEISERPAWLII